MVKEKNMTGGIYLKQLFFLLKCSHIIKISKEKLSNNLCFGSFEHICVPGPPSWFRPPDSVAVFGSSRGEAEGFVNGFLCEMVLIIGTRGLIFPLKCTHCSTHTSDCWLPLWSHWEEFPALQWGVGVLGSVFCCKRTSVERELWVWLPAMKVNTLLSEQQLLC